MQWVDHNIAPLLNHFWVMHNTSGVYRECFTVQVVISILGRTFSGNATLLGVHTVGETAADPKTTISVGPVAAEKRGMSTSLLNSTYGCQAKKRKRMAS